MQFMTFGPSYTPTLDGDALQFICDSAVAYVRMARAVTIPGLSSGETIKSNSSHETSDVTL